MNTDHRHGTDDPAFDEAVAAILRAASAPTRPGPQPGETAALTAFRAVEPAPRRTPMRSSLTPAKIAFAAAVSGGVLLTGGVAAAATGSLPGAAQDTARTVLSNVGVTVPSANPHADQQDSSDPTATSTEDAEDTSTEDTSTEDPADTGTSDDTTEGQSSEAPQEHPTNKGGTISELAHTTTATGVDKGAAISTAASGGKSQAGETHGTPVPGTNPGSSAEGRSHQTTPPTKPAAASHAHTATSTHSQAAGHRH
jgi:hypothetical protein